MVQQKIWCFEHFPAKACNILGNLLLNPIIKQVAHHFLATILYKQITLLLKQLCIYDQNNRHILNTSQELERQFLLHHALWQGLLMIAEQFWTFLKRQQVTHLTLIIIALKISWNHWGFWNPTQLKRSFWKGKQNVLQLWCN